MLEALEEARGRILEFGTVYGHNFERRRDDWAQTLGDQDGILWAAFNLLRGLGLLIEALAVIAPAIAIVALLILTDQIAMALSIGWSLVTRRR